jgi:hypothetical protein
MTSICFNKIETGQVCKGTISEPPVVHIRFVLLLQKYSKLVLEFTSSTRKIVGCYWPTVAMGQKPSNKTAYVHYIL